MALDQISSDPALEFQTMASDQNSSDPALECQTTALNHDSLSPVIQRQEKVVSKYSAVSTADAPNQRQQHTTPLTNHTTPAPMCQIPSLAPTVISPENINQAKTYAENDRVADNEFINIFSTPTKDHPLEQVIGNPSQPVKTRRQLESDVEMFRTRRQLESDGEMYMFALTLSQTEPKNIKEAMADSAWIESMQE
nr:hypothetical protein [Tanacetum cinerariifolium]